MYIYGHGIVMTKTQSMAPSQAQADRATTKVYPFEANPLSIKFQESNVLSSILSNTWLAALTIPYFLFNPINSLSIWTYINSPCLIDTTKFHQGTMFGREAFDALDAGSLGTWFALLHNVILRNTTWGTHQAGQILMMVLIAKKFHQMHLFHVLLSP